MKGNMIEKIEAELKRLKGKKLPSEKVDKKVDNSIELSAEQLWLKNRWGRITGTKVKPLSVVPRTRKTQINADEFNDTELELLAENLSNFDELMGTVYYNARDRGHFLEPKAVTYVNECFDTKFKQVDNLVMYKDGNDNISLSPDGLDNDNTKAIEIKCFEPKNHLKAVLETDKLKYEQLPQIIQYFVVIKDLKECWLCFYNPDFKDKELRLKRVIYKRDELNELIDKQTKMQLSILHKLGRAKAHLMVNGLN
jgi:hypothetical protein